MNIKFQISKVRNNTYSLKIHHIDTKFLNKIRPSSGDIISISFINKKIFKTQVWEGCGISDNHFSFYINNSTSKVEVNCNNNNQKFLMISDKKEQVINTDIPDFDKIFIKAIKVLSDTYNNLQLEYGL